MQNNKVIKNIEIIFIKSFFDNKSFFNFNFIIVVINKIVIMRFQI